MLTHFLLDVVSFNDDVNPILGDVKKALADSQQTKRKVDALESQIKNMQACLPSKKSKQEHQMDLNEMMRMLFARARNREWMRTWLSQSQFL